MEDAGVSAQRKLGYWEARKHMLYYQAAYQFVCVIGDEATSIIDVGAASTPFVDKFPWIPSRYALDFEIKNPLPGVTAIEGDFFAFTPEERFDVVVCMQVLEHVEDPTRFCEKLLGISRHLLISVPYKWSGAAPGHIQDPVDEAKLKSWIKREPNNFQIVTEPFREKRLIAYYNVEEGPSFRFSREKIIDAIARRYPLIP